MITFITPKTKVEVAAFCLPPRCPRQLLDRRVRRVMAGRVNVSDRDRMLQLHHTPGITIESSRTFQFSQSLANILDW